MKNRWKKYNELLKYIQNTQISKVWIDDNNHDLDYIINITSSQRYSFIIAVDDKKIELSCSTVARWEYYERPFYLKKDKNLYKKLFEIKGRILNK